jgi:hypothetical protein
MTGTAVEDATTDVDPLLQVDDDTITSFGVILHRRRLHSAAGS